MVLCAAVLCSIVTRVTVGHPVRDSASATRKISLFVTEIFWKCISIYSPDGLGIHSFALSPFSSFALSLFCSFFCSCHSFKERWERFAPVTLFVKSNKSKSLFKQWASRAFCSRRSLLYYEAKNRFAHFKSGRWRENFKLIKEQLLSSLFSTFLQPIPALYLLTWYSSANTSYVSTHLIFWNHSWLVISFTTSLTDSLNNVRAMIEKNTMELFKSLSIFCYMASHVLLSGFNNAVGATKSDLW